jgi:hypothetical protein
LIERFDRIDESQESVGSRKSLVDIHTLNSAILFKELRSRRYSRVIYLISKNFNLHQLHITSPSTIWLDLLISTTPLSVKMIK